jgi:AraC-like DNA-binding protein
MAKDHHQAVAHATGLAGLTAMSLVSSRTFPRHSHDQYGIGLIAFGGHRSWSQAGRVDALAGDIITVNPGEMHDGAPIGGIRRAWHMLYFDPELVRQSLGSRGSPTDLVSPALHDLQLKRLMSQIFDLAKAFPGDQMALEECCCRLLATAFSRHGSRRLKPLHGVPKSIARIRQRLDDMPEQNITLGELADMAGLSRFQLLRAFTRAHGTTPHAYLLQQRVLMARRLIAKGHGLSQAALEAGFSDQSHMSRAFSRQLGLTPGRYRRALAHV